MGRMPEQGTGAPKGWRKEAVLMLVLLVAGVATWHYVSPRSSPINAALTGPTLPAAPRTQRPITAEPSQFAGRAAEAYRAARERPALLERIPCYCGCYLTLGHQNLLDCFTDKHAATCDTCISMALEAARLDAERYPVEDILALLNRKYARPQHD